MATTRLRTWEITDEFWAKVETYIPNDLRCPGVNWFCPKFCERMDGMPMSIDLP